MNNLNNVFISLDFFSKKDVFDFETSIGYIKKALIFYYCSHSFPTNEASAAG